MLCSGALRQTSRSAGAAPSSGRSRRGRRRPAIHRPRGSVYRGAVFRSVVRGGVPADHRLERVADDEAVGDSAPRPRKTRDRCASARPGRTSGDEDAAAGAGAGLDQAAHLEQPDGLVDRGDRDAEAPAQVVLGAEALAGGRASSRISASSSRATASARGTRDARGEGRCPRLILQSPRWAPDPTRARFLVRTAPWRPTQAPALMTLPSVFA